MFLRSAVVPFSLISRRAVTVWRERFILTRSATFKSPATLSMFVSTPRIRKE